MENAAWIRQTISAGRDLHARRQPRFRHNAINTASALALLAGLAGVLALGVVLPWWLYVPLGAFGFGTLIFAAYVLVIHECSHAMFLVLRDPEQSRSANHRIGRASGVLLMTDYARHWQDAHRLHHLDPSRPRDPQAPVIRDGAPLFRTLPWLVVPGSALFLNPARKKEKLSGWLLASVGLWTALSVAGAVWIAPAFPLVVLYGWNVSFAHWALKMAQEHGSNLAKEENPFLRTRTYLHPLSKLLSPFSIAYHFEHHANFSVPWYLLPEYHRRVRAIMPRALHRYYFTLGFREYWDQLWGRRPLPPASLRPLIESTPEEVAAAPLDAVA